MQKNQAQVLGDTDIYEIAPDIKKYSLLDAGFVEGRNDHFKLERPISGTSPYDARFLLKISISEGFSHLRMSITDKSGLHNINIYKAKDTKSEIDDYKFMMNFLEEKNILIKK